MAGIPFGVKLQGILVIILSILSIVLNYLLMSNTQFSGAGNYIINGYNFSQTTLVGSLALPVFPFCPLPSVAKYAGYITAPIILLGLLQLFLKDPKSKLVTIYIILGGILLLVAPPMSAILSILDVMCDLKNQIVYAVKIFVFISASIQLFTVLSSLYKIAKAKIKARNNKPAPPSDSTSPGPSTKAEVPATPDAKTAVTVSASVPLAAPLIAVPKTSVPKMNASPYKLNYYPIAGEGLNSPTVPYQSYQIEPRYAPQPQAPQGPSPVYTPFSPPEQNSQPPKDPLILAPTAPPLSVAYFDPSKVYDQIPYAFATLPGNTAASATLPGNTGEAGNSPFGAFPPVRYQPGIYYKSGTYTPFQ